MSIWWAIVLMAIASIFSVLSPIFLKKSSYPVEKYGYRYNVLHRLNLVIGIGLYGLSFIISIVALKNGDVSILYPIMSLSYIWVCLFSMKFLGETMSFRKWQGIALIMIGVIIMGVVV